VTALEAKAAMRASLNSDTWFHLEAAAVYDKTYAGPAEKKNEIIEALCRGENVEKFFDLNLVNCIDVTDSLWPPGSKALIGLPDTWEESWDEGLGTGTVVITTTMDVENGDHGGHPRVDILSIVKVEAPM